MQKKGYKFLEHTADVMVCAWGKDFFEAIQQVAYAMFETLGATKKIRSSKFFLIEETSQYPDELIVNFFSSILSNCELLDVLPCKIQMNSSCSLTHISAKIYYCQNRPSLQIKAITYHQLKCWVEKNTTFVQVLFDI
jgi:SHS2 domain-containing protein